MRGVRKASARDLFKEWVPKIADKEWLANSHYQSYFVLNLCRILHTVGGNEPSSKRLAADWVKGRYREWKDLVDEAEKWGYGEEMKRQEEAIAVIKFVIAFFVTGVTIFQCQSGCLQAYRGVLRRTALTERKGIG